MEITSQEVSDLVQYSLEETWEALPEEVDNECGTVKTPLLSQFETPEKRIRELFNLLLRLQAAYTFWQEPDDDKRRELTYNIASYRNIWLPEQERQRRQNEVLYSSVARAYVAARDREIDTLTPYRQPLSSFLAFQFVRSKMSWLRICGSLTNLFKGDLRGIKDLTTAPPMSRYDLNFLLYYTLHDPGLKFGLHRFRPGSETEGWASSDGLPPLMIQYYHADARPLPPCRDQSVLQGGPGERSFCTNCGGIVTFGQPLPVREPAEPHRGSRMMIESLESLLQIIRDRQAADDARDAEEAATGPCLTSDSDSEDEQVSTDEEVAGDREDDFDDRAGRYDDEEFFRYPTDIPDEG